MGESKIEWTDETWNVTTGCTRVSAGCDNCYAVAMTRRLAGIEATKEKYSGLVNEGKDHFNGTIKLHMNEIDKPFRWKKPRMVFVNSMSDLFHPNVPFWFIDQVFMQMGISDIHTFQVLTKRPDRMAEYLSTITERILMDSIVTWPFPNVWLGTSVENQETANKRIPHLLKCPAAVRFLSCEPLLGPINIKKALCDWDEYKKRSAEIKPGALRMGGKTYTVMNHLYSPIINGLDWVIVGGESGHNARPMHPDWARSLRDQCVETGVSFFFKQWGKYLPFKQQGPINDIRKFIYGGLENLPAIEMRLVNGRQEPFFAAGKKEAGRLLDGREWDQMPEVK